MIVGLLLAAGAGTRFGGDKLLAPLAGRALVLHSLDALRGGVDEVLAVVRPGDDALCKVLKSAGVTLSTCPDAALGMGHSLAWGALQAVAGAHLIVALADMPRVRVATVQAVAGALRGGVAIVVPVHEQRRGHPVGFTAALRPEIATLAGDAGARRMLELHREAVRELPVPDAGILLDVDTPATLATLDR